MEGKVSVIVPVYNVEKYLGKCIESILRQTYKNFEMILVDDGSKDSSSVICKKYENLDKRVKYVYQDNKGLSGARNTGLDVATGDYVFFVDSDDYIEKETFMKCVYFLEQGYDICSFCGRRVNENDECIYELNYDKIDDIKLENDSKYNIIARDLLSYRMGWEVCMSAYQMEFLKKNNIKFDESIKYAEDAVFTLECFLKASKYIKIPDILYNYLFRDNSLSMIDSNEKDDKQLYLISNLCKIVEDEISKDNISDKDKKWRFTLLYMAMLDYHMKQYYSENNIKKLYDMLREYSDISKNYLNFKEVANRKKELERIYGKEEGFKYYTCAKFFNNGNFFIFRVRRKLHSKGLI